MSLKIHFLQPYLDFSPGNMGAVSDGQNERFHQDVFRIEKVYSGKWNTSMLDAGTETPAEEYKRQKTRK
jgi:hypothetical protein